MERRHLEYFIAVVEAGSISEAARRMHLSQPSVSQAIKELERELQAPLIERGRTMTLTAAGRAAVGAARRALRSFDGVRAAIDQVDDLQTGVLDIAIEPMLSVDPGTELIMRFRRRYPGVRLRVREAAADVEGLESLRRGEAELLLHRSPAAYSRYRMLSLPLTPFFVVFPPGTQLPEAPLPLREFVRHPIIMGLAPDSAVRVWFVSELAAQQLPPLNIVVETAHRDAILPLVLAGLGATMLPETEARVAERLGAVVRPPDFSFPRTCHLLHRREPLSPAAEAFVDLASEMAAEGADTAASETP